MSLEDIFGYISSKTGRILSKPGTPMGMGNEWSCTYLARSLQQQGRRLTFTVGYSNIKHGFQLSLYFNVFHKSLTRRQWCNFVFFFCKNLHRKCVSIQNSTWILLRSAAPRQRSTLWFLAGAREYSSWVLNTYTFIAQKVAIFLQKKTAKLHH